MGDANEVAIVVPIRNDGDMNSGRQNGVLIESREWILEILGRVSSTWFG